MQYTYEFEMWRGEFAWIAAPFDLVGITQGVDVEDVCESAADLLRELIQEYLMRGEQPPRAVDACLEHVERMSAAEAAKVLGVSRSRITAMLDSGLLEGWREGRNTWVTVDSVAARKASPAPTGRPRKKTESAL